MAGLKGLASWFCCGNAWGPCGSTGHGVCGTCNSGSHQHAWPNVSAACLAVTHPDTCGLTVTRRACGFTHQVTNLCNGRQIASKVAECGPATHRSCGQRACCGGGTNCASNRVIDLTPAAFSALGGLSGALFPVQITP